MSLLLYRQLVENTAVYYGCCSALIHLDDTLILFQVSCIFTTLRYANALFAVVACPSVCPSLRHKPVLYRNDWFWHGGFLQPIPHCVIKKLGISKIPVEFCPKLRKISPRQWSIALSTKLIVVVVDGRVC